MTETEVLAHDMTTVYETLKHARESLQEFALTDRERDLLVGHAVTCFEELASFLRALRDDADRP